MAEFTRYHRNNGNWNKVEETKNKGLKEKPRITTLVPKSEVTHTAVSSGEWNDSKIWDNGVPKTDARVHIPSGTTVTLTHQESKKLKTVRIDGTFKVDPTVNTRLRVDTIVATSGSRFEIGTETDPIQSGVTAEIEFIDNGPVTRSDDDPYMISRGLITMGDLEIVGAEKTAWTKLSQNPKSGDTGLELDQEPTNWQVGDLVVTPDVEPYKSDDLVMENGQVKDLEHKDEERTISSTSGTTVNFDIGLDYNHLPPESGLYTYVLNLTRNVKFYSENSDLRHRGHFMVMKSEATIRYLEVNDMGRTDKSRDPTTPNWYRGTPESESPENPRARYSIHFHHTDPTNPPHRVVGCVVNENPGWGYVNHSSNAEIENCISYKVTGSGFNTEKGNENGHFKNNFALRSKGSGEEISERKGWNNGSPMNFLSPPSNVDDFAHSGHGFWIHSPIVEVEGNVAAGHRAHGFVFFHRSLYEEPLDMENGEALDGKNDMFPDMPEELLTEDERDFGVDGSNETTLGTTFHDQDPSMYFSQRCRLRKFENNEAFGSGAGCGFRSVSHRNEHERPEWADLKNFTAWNIGPHFLEDGSKQGQRNNFQSSGNVGIDHRYLGNIAHHNYRLIGTGGGIGSNKNHSYMNAYDLHSSSIKNFKYGFTPKSYNEKGYNYVTGTVFNNETDILLTNQFPDNKTALYLNGNSYNGSNRLEWRELNWGGLNPRRFLNQRKLKSTRVLWENRTVYHGWSRPDFVICQEGDSERLDLLMLFEEEWRNALDGDDPRNVLPGITLQQLYDQYGLTFYGAVQDPSQPGFEQPDDFLGSETKYDSTPYLGPKPEDKTMPTDEIWVDVRKMERSGDAYLIDSSSHPGLSEAIEMSNSDTLVKMEKNSSRSGEPSGSDGIISYRFDIDTDGPYQIYLRCNIQQRDDVNDAQRRAYYRINGGNWKESNAIRPKFGSIGLDWMQLTLDENLKTTNNTQTIEISPYDGRLDMAADWLLINHKTVGAPPVGDGKPHTN